jgi:hypothetical protein
MAASTVVTLPLVIVFFLYRQRFINGNSNFKHSKQSFFSIDAACISITS